MFESTKDVLTLFGEFVVVGFFIAVFYNVLKLIRLSIISSKLISVILDFVSVFMFGAVVFIFSVELGTGFFRLYYVFAALIGFALNMLTIGLITKPLSKLIKKIVLLIRRTVAAPLLKAICSISEKFSSFFVKNVKKITKVYENRKIHLKNDTDLVYNIDNNTIGEVYQKGGESRNVIKAKVRKNS